MEKKDKSAKKSQDKIWRKKFVINQKLDQIIKGKLSWCNLQPSVSPCALSRCCFQAVCALPAYMHLWGQTWHLCMGKKTGYGTAPVSSSSFIFCISVAVQGAVAYLVSTFDSNDTELFSCLRLPCVTSCKNSSDKHESLNGSLWTLKQNFSVLLLCSEPSSHFFFFCISLRTWKWHKIHIRSSVSICLAKFLHINLFGRNDKNQSARPAAYDCQVTQIQQ